MTEKIERDVAFEAEDIFEQQRQVSRVSVWADALIRAGLGREPLLSREQLDRIVERMRSVNLTRGE